MNKSILALFLIASSVLSSCGRDIAVIGGADGPTKIIVAGTDTAEAATEAVTEAATEAITEAATAETDTTEPLTDSTNLQFIKFDDCAVGWNEREAWVFDYVTDSIVPIFDNGDALSEIDKRGLGSKYFEDHTLAVTCRIANSSQLQINFTVRSDTYDAVYEAYRFYALGGTFGEPRGTVSGYYCEGTLTYPDIAVTVTDVADSHKLMLHEDSWLVRLISAVVTVDTEEMEACLNAEPGTFDSWKSLVISDYTITRTQFFADYADRLDGTMTVTESGLDTLPPGRYSIAVHDGPGHNVQIFNLDSPSEPRELNEAERWLYYWVTYGGAEHYTDYNNYGTDKHFHDLADFYFVDAETPNYEDFLRFCQDVFGVTDAGEYVSREFIEQHGGHGGKTVISRITDDVITDGKHVITVNFYADVMYTVLARTNEYIIAEKNGRFVFEDVRTVYDSGLKIKFWYT